MLSRDAEHLYWLTRYVERLENIARMINVHSELMLDFPGDKSLGWKPIIKTMDSEKLFQNKYSEYSEISAVKFLGDDKENENSIISSLEMARYNARAIKDDLPRSATEQLNNLFNEFSGGMSSSSSRRKRASYIYNVISGTQRFFGIISDNFSRGYAFEFMRLGRFVERIDMNSRIIDSLCINKSNEQTHDFHTLEWVSMLRTLSAHESFRKEIRGEIERGDVINFLLKNENFPRSIYRCLTITEKSLSALPKNNDVLEVIKKLNHRVFSARLNGYDDKQLHNFLDYLQRRIHLLDEKIHKNYFHNYL